MKHIRIHLATMKSERKVAVPQAVMYWKELWDSYTTDYPSVEIHCWKEETEQIKELTPIASHIKEQGLIISFTISLDEANRAYLRGQSTDPEGGLKWFTLHFYKEGIQMLEIIQYGSEINLYGVDKNEAAEFERLFPDTVNAEYFKEHPM